ncbi:MAG: coenzyme F420-0:L-glutamate ligase [Promethearchaeota archaeon]
MVKKISIYGIEGIPLIKPGDNIAEIIIKALEKENISLQDKDIILIAQSIISKSLGLILDLNKIDVSVKAKKIWERISQKSKEKNLPSINPEFIQVVIDESNEIIRAEHILITETKHGFICANAGVDRSNSMGKNKVTLLPREPDKEALKIRNYIKEKTGKNVAIVITDSFGRPFRKGSVGVAIGTSGIEPLYDRRGEKDLYGYELEDTIVGHIDNLASASQLIMGESNEGIPVVIIRGYNFELNEKASINQIIIEKDFDLFRR